ncbi:MAG: hypothetical protein FD173_599 [Gallionellaceae bacterium]|nr:MAG: hypothetical protein FD173_599 [Gallionellaceae bacterium]
MRYSTSLIALILLFTGTGCSQNSLLTRHDYDKSQRNFVRGDANDALLDLPRRAEQGTFINAMESGYLNLIQGKAEIKPLQQQAKVLEDRVRYHVSREAKTFFYLQTPEDYYASEHEVIWLHMLLSWGYSLKGQFENACVEARVAGSLLSLPWSPVGHFDDPTMRLFLASLWTMCGDWREAQVDLRAAWVMDNSLVWAKELASREHPPAHLFAVLGGPGPDPVWSPEHTLNPLRSERKVSFKLRGQKSTLTLNDRTGLLIPNRRSPDAANWYARHVARESELHEVILDSVYGGNAAISGIVATAKITASSSLGLAIGVGGSVLGAAVMYVGARGNSDDIVLAGAGIVGTSLKEGWDISKQGYEESTSELAQRLNPSESYRFVRYLPEYLWMGWSDQALSYPMTLRTPYSYTSIAQPGVVNDGTSVSIAHLPDARESSLDY